MATSRKAWHMIGVMTLLVSLVASQAPTCSKPVARYAQCGGLNAANQADAPNPAGCCEAGDVCTKFNAWHWQCEPKTNGTPVITTSPSPNPTTATVIIDGKSYPACANASAASPADNWGRRWGWENNASCVVDPAPTPTPVPSPKPATPTPSPAPVYNSPAPKIVGIDGQSFAVCVNTDAAAPADAWGRRWGYENNASCVVDGAPDVPTKQVDGKAYAVCADAAKAGQADAYGRRWGWENGASCIVVVMPTKVIDGKTWPVCAAAPTNAPDAQGRRWGWENGNSCVYSS